MKIEDILNEINKQNDDNKYIADEFVENDYGQTVGGYREKNKVPLKQKEHFINYYSQRKDKLPSFSRLYCPELMLWIAEFVGLKKEIIEDARNYIISFEEDNDLEPSDKGALYLRIDKTRPITGTDENILKEFKNRLKIGDINRILKEADSWCTAKDNIKKYLNQ